MISQNAQLHTDQSGFSLIETVVAITILLVVVSGVMNLIYQGTTASQQQQERITATYLATEAIEFIRADRDTYWLEDIGSHAFDDWINSTDVSVCQSTNGCTVDARIGTESINACSGDCDILKYNTATKMYSYGSGVNWKDSRYRRTVEIQTVDHGSNGVDDEALITITVSWQRSGGETSTIIVRESLSGWWR
ncbi:MAG: prepilin-type N-terminal cleavage/methylation domain-containing protein [Candidatus Paceibacterota bacterium]